MSKRSRTSQEQSKHDKKVKKLAQKLDRKGYSVKADVEGYPQPDSVGYKNPRIPDIYATGHGWKRMIEVETESSLHTKTAQNQHDKFRQWSYREDNRKYERIVI